MTAPAHARCRSGPAGWPRAVRAAAAACMLGLLSGCATQARDAGPRRPNVLVMFVDQLRWCDVGCYGNQVIRTPNLDRLASEGARFAGAFTNFPSCSPARSTLLSGQYARSNGLYANQSGGSVPRRPTNRDTTLAEALAARGYETAFIGKWHLTPDPQVLGFSRSWRQVALTSYYHARWRVNERPETDYPYEGYTLEHESELARQFLRERRDRPFFLYLAPSPPHMPLADLPETYKSLYDPATIPLRPNVWKDGQLAFDEHWFKIYLWDSRYYAHRDTFTEPLPAGIDLARLHALYYGQISAVDDWAGRVLRELQTLGLAENTIVLFSSDHGDLLGSHHLYNKNEHYDEAARIPMLVRWPGRVAPRVIDRQIASLVDAMPTLLDLCGAPIPASVQGTSLALVLTGRADTVGPNAAFIETTRNEGVRTLQHLYYCGRRNSRDEVLFDVQRDPYQMTNLTADPARRETLADLRERTRAWRERTPAVQPVTTAPASSAP